MSLFLDILGWIGMICILVAFYLISNEKVTARNKSYQVLNVIGSGLFIINLSFAKAWPAVTLNVVYALIASYSLLKIYRRKEDPDSSQ